MSEIPESILTWRGPDYGLQSKMKSKFKTKSRIQVTNHETSSGAFIEIDPASGWIRRVYICARDDQAAEVVRSSFARITKPSCFGWLRHLWRRKAGDGF
jgi:hypothetical protein